MWVAFFVVFYNYGCHPGYRMTYTPEYAIRGVRGDLGLLRTNFFLM